MKIIYLLALAFFLPLVNAVPILESAQGIANDGAQITLIGNFGSQGKVELVDRPDYSDTSRFFTQQTVNSWNTNSITVTINYPEWYCYNSYLNPRDEIEYSLTQCPGERKFWDLGEGSVAYIYVTDSTGARSEPFEIYLGRDLAEIPSPIVVSYGGSTFENQVMTIQGNHLGTHTLDYVSTLGPDGIIESSSIGFEFDTTWGALEDSNTEGWYRGEHINKIPARIVNDNSYSGQKAIYSGVDKAANGAGDWQRAVGWYNPNGFDEVFASFYVYFNPTNARTPDYLNEGGGQSATQLKQAVISAVNHHSDCKVIHDTISWYDPLNSVTEIANPHLLTQGHVGVPFTVQSDHLIPVDPYYPPRYTNAYNYKYLYWDGSVPAHEGFYNFREWARVDMYGKMSDVDIANGVEKLAFRNPTDRRVKPADFRNTLNAWSECSSPVPYNQDPSSPWRTFFLIGYWDDNGNNFADEAMDMYYDDIYIQFGTEARVELCNNQNYDLATACEIQPPTDWNTESVKVKVNYGGAFNQGDTAWLFLTDENGVRTGPLTVQLGEPPEGPYISGVTDSTPDNGQSITVNGLNFGTHSLDISSGVGPNGWIETEADGTELESLNNNWQGHSGEGGDAISPIISSSRVRTGSQAIDATIDKVLNGANQYNAVISYNSPSEFNEVYASWWVLIEPQYMEGSFIGWKHWFAGGFNHHSACGSFTARYQFQSLSSYGAAPSVYGDCANSVYAQCIQNIDWSWTDQPGGYDYPDVVTRLNRGGLVSPSALLPVIGEWARFEVYLKASSDWGAEDAEFEYYIFRNGVREHIDTWGSFITHQAVSECQSYTSDPGFNYFTLLNYLDDNNGTTDEIVDLYFDDIYLQFGTKARVELCNSPDFDTATVCEIQTPTDWNTNQIDMLVNYGSMMDATAYLYVIDDSGDVSNGYPITLGDGGSSSGPTCYDNIQNQGEEGVDCGGPCGQQCAECTQGEIGSACTTSAGCDGVLECTGGSWSCVDSDPSDNCPVVGDSVVLQNDDVSYLGQVDACISQFSPSETFDDCRTLASSTRRNLFYFDLSVLPAGREVLSANLVLNEVSLDGYGTLANRDVTLIPLLKPWDSSAVNWLGTGVESWQQSGAYGVTDQDSSLSVTEFVADNQPVTFDVTSIVSDWYANPSNNHGVVLTATSDGDGYVSFAPDDYSTVQKRPKLIISFVDSGCTPTQFDVTGVCGTVDFDDFLVVVENFRTTNTRYDFNNDNQVNVLDLVLHLLNWS